MLEPRALMELFPDWKEKGVCSLTYSTHTYMHTTHTIQTCMCTHICRHIHTYTLTHIHRHTYIDACRHVAIQAIND